MGKIKEIHHDGITGQVNPNKIRSNYGVDQYSVPSSASGPQGSQAAGQFYTDYFYPSDLIQFQSDWGLPENNITAAHTIGKNQPNRDGINDLTEPSLDYQYISTVNDIETWAFTNAESFINYCQIVAETEDAPYVQSLSWGSTESVTGSREAFRTSDEFMKLTTQGFTFFLAAGDSATSSTNRQCSKFDPGFPATSPYVTAVGATSTGSTECGASWAGSGFSTFFNRPSYQEDAVSTYLETASSLPSSYLFNSSGRAIPDVSIIGYNYEILVEGSYYIVYGTSASTPVTASLVAYGNILRQQNGDGPLGNINQRLYEADSIGQDITCGESKYTLCPSGFVAAVGWDPASGLGTPEASTFYSVLTI